MDTPRVLVVDDDPMIRRLVVATLATLGAEFAEAVDGDDALARAREFEPKLVVLDVAMPKRSGYDVCSVLKHEPSLPGIKVLLLTARVGDQERVAAEAAGADVFLSKPFRPRELLRVAQELLA